MSRNTRNVEAQTIDQLAGRMAPLLQNNALGCRVYRSIDQNISNNSWTAIGFDNEEYDGDECWSSGAGSTRLTANTPGLYLIGGGVAFNAAVVGTTGARVSVSVRVVGTAGTAYQSPGATHMTVSGQWAAASECVPVWMDEGDYAQIMAYQNMGTTKAASGGRYWTVGWMACLMGK